MLQRILASRFAGTLLIALAALTVAAGVFGFVQTKRLASANEMISGQKLAIDLARDMIAQRDLAIDAQNKSIEGLSKAATAGREVYIRDYGRADALADRHDDRAAEIMATTIDRNADELAQCRAARTLMEKELTQ